MIFKTLTDTAQQPTRATESSAGLDVCADINEAISVAPGCTEIIPTGVVFEHDSQDDWNWFIGLYIRSSMSVSGWVLANGTGVIDKDFNGNEIKVILTNVSNNPLVIKPQQRIAQMIVQLHFIDRANGVVLKYDKREGGLGSSN